MADATILNDHATLTTTCMTARNGEHFFLDFYFFPQTLKNVPYHPDMPTLSHIHDIALKSFPHWVDDGELFKEELNHSVYLSLIKTETGEVIGFTHYSGGKVSFTNGVEMTYMYTKYIALNEEYRSLGLMRKACIQELLQVNPDIFLGSSAVGEIHMMMKRVSEDTKRFFYPSELTVPENIGKVGRGVYAEVNGEDTYASIDPHTLVRKGMSPYSQGKMEYELFAKHTLGINDTMIFLSLSPESNAKILSMDEVVIQQTPQATSV